ncbi:MAG: shikimate kinase [Nitrospira bacterium HGW-Nitrospira-1]|nr:MAG: shikimate kinase [Nitrospira bacterium HGW-Nitrospira-1]
MKNIVLTGFMGTGKTTIGKALARMLHTRLVDVDEEIESAQKMTINDIFKIYGEQHFRDIETAMIKKLAQERGIIISTGGGSVLRDENMVALKENGIVFCLNADAETILERTSRHEDRPLLKVENPKEKINELLACRRPFYEKAGIMIETGNKSPLEIAQEIMETVKWRK